MQIGKDMCERKAYPRKVCPDRSLIRLRVNGALDAVRLTSRFVKSFSLWKSLKGRRVFL